MEGESTIAGLQGDNRGVESLNNLPSVTLEISGRNRTETLVQYLSFKARHMKLFQCKPV